MNLLVAFKFLFIFSLSVLQVSCLGRGTDEAAQFRITEVNPNTTSLVDFSLFSQEVLTPHCLKCHQEYQNESNVLKQVVPGSPSESRLYQLIESGEMPQGQGILSSNKIELTARYIVDLEKRSLPNPDPPSDPPLKATYQSLDFHLFQESCTQCHFTQNPNGRVPLDSYESVVKNAEEIYFQIDFEQMPPDGPPPSREMVEIFREWIDAEFPKE